MKENASHTILRSKLQQKIVKILYQEGKISLTEYELITSKLERKILKAKKNIESHPTEFKYPVKLDIKI